MQTKNSNITQANANIHQESMPVLVTPTKDPTLRLLTKLETPVSSTMPSLETPVASPIYITMPSSCKARTNNQNSESFENHQENMANCGFSSPYQPPPLPPRLGSIQGVKHPPGGSNVGHQIQSSNHCATSSSVNASCTSGPYKPVPPPKPFASQGIHSDNQDLNSHGGRNGGSYPPILVTEEGQFLTHSTKFPIHDENQKLMYNGSHRPYNENGGIDNPALIAEEEMRISLNHKKEISTNHYTQMRNYDSSRIPQYLTNGHQPKPPQYGHQTQANLQANNWQMNDGMSYYNHQSPDKRQMKTNQMTPQEPMNSIPPTNRPYNVAHHQQNGASRSISFAPGTTFHDQEDLLRIQSVSNGAVHLPSHSNGITYSHSHMNGTPSHNPMNGMVPHSHMNGVNGKSLQINQMNAGLFGQTNGTTALPAYGRPNSSQYSNGYSNNGVGTKKPEDDNADNIGNEEMKREEKWGSLKKAGKTYSHFKNIFSKKTSKGDTAKNTQEGISNNAGVCTTNSQGQNTNEGATETQIKPSIPECYRNGDPHASTSEENCSSFQRAIQYSSLKARLEEPSNLPATDSSIYIYPDRNQYRLSGRNNNPYGAIVPDTRNHSEILASKRAGSCSHLGMRGVEVPAQMPSWSTHHRSDENLNRILPSDHPYPETKPKSGSIHHLPSGKGGSDSGRGTGGSGNELKGHDTSLESGSSNARMQTNGQSSGNESEWIDLPDTDASTKLPFIKEIDRRFDLSGTKTPPLPPLSPEAAPKVVRHRAQGKEKKQSHSFSMRAGTNNKPDLLKQTELNGQPINGRSFNDNQGTLQRSTSLMPSTMKGWMNKQLTDESEEKIKSRGTSALEMNKKIQPLSRPPIDNSRRTEGTDRWARPFSQYEDDDITSTDAALDLNSMLDGATEATTDDDLETRDEDTYLIRRQLEGLEGMYSEVLKVLGNRRPTRHGELRPLRRRLHGSMSSIPSSIMSSRPIRDKKGKVIDDRSKKNARDPPAKTTHKRFQRLESHVVTLARSVAHLSSEMRNQQLMFQEIEGIRNELSALRVATRTGGGMSYPKTSNNGNRGGNVLWNPLESGALAFTNSGRVKKLTQFFGDEPPLVRIFLKKLGYEKYAPIFEKEKVGMVELPYMTEERLQKMGIPMGPRLRILQEAQGPIKTEGNLSVYVV